MKQILMIEGRREGYAPRQITGTVTVKELIEFLEQFEDDTEVMLDNDNGYTYGSIDYDSFALKGIEKNEDGDDELIDLD